MQFELIKPSDISHTDIIENNDNENRTPISIFRFKFKDEFTDILC